VEALEQVLDQVEHWHGRTDIYISEVTKKESSKVVSMVLEVMAKVSTMNGLNADHHTSIAAMQDKIVTLTFALKPFDQKETRITTKEVQILAVETSIGSLTTKEQEFKLDDTGEAPVI